MILACVPLPAPGGPSRMMGPISRSESIECPTTTGALSQMSQLRPGAAAANTATAGRKSFVVTHHQLRFDLRHGIHRNTHHDQQRRATEIKVHAQTVGHPSG